MVVKTKSKKYNIKVSTLIENSIAFISALVIGYIGIVWLHTLFTNI